MPKPTNSLPKSSQKAVYAKHRTLLVVGSPVEKNVEAVISFSRFMLILNKFFH